MTYFEWDFCLFQAVKLESVHPSRTRYLVVVSRMGRRAEESCLLGIDCNEKTTVGLVLRVLADTAITLDGDGYVLIIILSNLLCCFCLKVQLRTQKNNGLR